MAESPIEKEVRGSGEKHAVQYYEHAVDAHGNLVYENLEEEPELHVRTYLALASMFLLNLVQVFALQGPPAVVCPSSQRPTVSSYPDYMP
jgi:hypothetical protein